MHNYYYKRKKEKKVRGTMCIVGDNLEKGIVWSTQTAVLEYIYVKMFG